MMTRTAGLALCLALTALAGCKIVKTASKAADPDAALIAGVVSDTYETKLLPLVTDKAVDAASLLPLTDLETAGAAHGLRGKGEGGSWTFAIKGQGQVVDEDRKSRAGKVNLDINGDGKADLTLQIGPVVKGTALRDIAPFYDFTAFRDQIQFAQLGRALNDKTVGALALPPDLTGKTLSFLGAFQVQQGSDPVLVVPLSVEVK